MSSLQPTAQHNKPNSAVDSNDASAAGSSAATQHANSVGNSETLTTSASRDVTPVSPAHRSDATADPESKADSDNDLLSALMDPEAVPHGRVVALDAGNSRKLVVLDNAVSAPHLPTPTTPKNRMRKIPKSTFSISGSSDGEDDALPCPMVLLNLSRVQDVVRALALPEDDTAIQAALKAAVQAHGDADTKVSPHVSSEATSQELESTPEGSAGADATSVESAAAELGKETGLPMPPSKPDDLDALLHSLQCPTGALVSPLTAHLFCPPRPVGCTPALPSAAPSAPSLPSVASIAHAVDAAEARYNAAIAAGVSWAMAQSMHQQLRTALPQQSHLRKLTDEELVQRMVRMLVPPFERSALVCRLVGHSSSPLGTGSALLGAIVSDSSATSRLHCPPEETTACLTMQELLSRFQDGIDPAEAAKEAPVSSPTPLPVPVEGIVATRATRRALQKATSGADGEEEGGDSEETLTNEKLRKVAQLALAATAEAPMLPLPPGSPLSAQSSAHEAPTPVPVALSMLRSSSSEDLVQVAASATRRGGLFGGTPLPSALSTNAAAPQSPGFAASREDSRATNVDSDGDMELQTPAAPTRAAAGVTPIRVHTDPTPSAFTAALPDASPRADLPRIMVEPLDSSAARGFARAVATRARVASASLEGGLVMLWVPGELTCSGRPQRLMYVPPELGPEELTFDQALHRQLLAEAMAKQEALHGAAAGAAGPQAAAAGASAVRSGAAAREVSDMSAADDFASAGRSQPPAGAAVRAGDPLSSVMVFPASETNTSAAVATAAAAESTSVSSVRSPLLAVALQPYEAAARATQVEAASFADVSQHVREAAHSFVYGGVGAATPADAAASLSAAQNVAGPQAVSVSTIPSAPAPIRVGRQSPPATPAGTPSGTTQATAAPIGRTMLDVYTPRFTDLGRGQIAGEPSNPIPQWHLVAREPVDVSKFPAPANDAGDADSPPPGFASPLPPSSPPAASPASSVAAAAAGAAAAAAAGGAQADDDDDDSEKPHDIIRPPMDHLYGEALPWKWFTPGVDTPAWRRPVSAWDTFPQRAQQLEKDRQTLVAVLPPDMDMPTSPVLLPSPLDEAAAQAAGKEGSQAQSSKPAQSAATGADGRADEAAGDQSPLRRIRITNLGVNRGKYPLSHLSWYYDDGTHDEWAEDSAAGVLSATDLRDCTFNVKHDIINEQLKQRMAEVRKRAHRRKKDKAANKARATAAAAASPSTAASLPVSRGKPTGGKPFTGGKPLGGMKRPLTPLSMPAPSPASPGKKARSD